MTDITPDTLKEMVERLAKEHNFPVGEIFAAEDDYSLPEIEKLGLWRRNEKLIGCNLYNDSESKEICLEYRVFNGSRKVFVGILRGAFEKEERKIIENELLKEGVAFQKPNPSIKDIERFLSAYFRAQRQADEYIKRKRELEAQYSLRQKYLFIQSINQFFNQKLYKQ